MEINLRLCFVHGTFSSQLNVCSTTGNRKLEKLLVTSERMKTNMSVRFAHDAFFSYLVIILQQQMES